MKRLILPLVLLLLGLGGGVGAAVFLTPPPPTGEELAVLGPCGEIPPEEADTTDAHAAPEPSGHGTEAGEDGLGAGFEYVKLNNQFVVPVVQDTEVTALVILSISVEVPEGQDEAVMMVEPKLRDVFLQVLFDHANTGGFEGMFTSSNNMRSLRNALRTAAQDALGTAISDVLIVDLVRQDV